MNSIHPAIHAFKQKLFEQFGSRVVRFTVFGSYARGEHTPESDIDILVTLSGKVDWQLEFTIWDLAYNIDLAYDVILNVKVFSEEDILHTIHGRTPFMQNVMTEGIPV